MPSSFLLKVKEVLQGVVSHMRVSMQKYYQIIMCNMGYWQLIFDFYLLEIWP